MNTLLCFTIFTATTLMKMTMTEAVMQQQHQENLNSNVINGPDNSLAGKELKVVIGQVFTNFLTYFIYIFLENKNFNIRFVSVFFCI